MTFISKTCSFAPKIIFKSNMFQLKIQIETKRLIISSYEDKDFENCVLLYGDKILTKFFDEGKPKTRGEVKKLIEKRGKQYFNRRLPFGLFSIFEKDSKNFIGQVDLLPITEPSVLEVGFILNRRYQNKGYCPEVMKVFLNDFIYKINSYLKKNKLKPIYKIVATTHPKNFASIRMIKFLKMNFEKRENRFSAPRLWYSYFIPNLNEENQKVGA